jgi:hypothetical protein
MYSSVSTLSSWSDSTRSIGHSGITWSASLLIWPSTLSVLAEFPGAVSSRAYYRGNTDAELAQTLHISLLAVKLRWRVIYDRVDCTRDSTDHYRPTNRSLSWERETSVHYRICSQSPRRTKTFSSCKARLLTRGPLSVDSSQCR